MNSSPGCGEVLPSVIIACSFFELHTSLVLILPFALICGSGPRLLELPQPNPKLSADQHS